MSVSSSIYNYVVENGRTYHRYKEGKYMLPNDEVRRTLRFETPLQFHANVEASSPSKTD